MKKFKYSFIASALLGVSLVGCYDMDTEPLGATITADQKEETVSANPVRIEASATAVTALMTAYQNTVENHADFGYPSIMLLTDCRGTDLVSEDIGYNWFTMPVSYEDINNTYWATYLYWRTCYKQIYAANSLAKIIDPETTDPALQFYLAQAYAFRAFDYFTLAQMYQHTYVGNQDMPCVPLITEANMDAAGAEGCARSTVAEVYEQIMTDLDAAIVLLETTTMPRKDKRYVSAEVAYGIRARVNLVMNNWAEAAADAAKALELTSATPYTIAQVSKPGMSDIDDAAWMWGVLISETDDVVKSEIINWPSHMGSLNYGYASVGAWRRISKALYGAIPSTDVRKGWFLDENGVSPYLTAEQANYVANTAGCPPYTQVKFGTYQDVIYQSVNCNDIPLMRAEEMYLILAEAQAMAGDPAAGAATLQNFVTTFRDPAYVCNATTDVAVQDAVWMQRRIELWGEGFSYFDLMRLNKGVDRRGAGFQEAYIYNIPAGDPALIYRLPKAEIEGNPLISDAQNNPAASVPTPVSE